ncbi:soluble scavenger receptor cysteine-rich domain-containing protein SSC5D-like [Eurytemora carolleeae]|uniref:soluble scavenger receptor cysteine-rich domain-containing protein SSC5D-like n=1 Tax=Eurytemora carolleeae TaxID=1294199 RepID=UPI000C77D21E|nr:soluble scavenger receptor cysteine-rich domain-containing protein SSC5D-like [Eurytemora carolleeae]|eukprot:XP_023340818.1 soluble scavenger receptor cysteine-rich domain-containing protein SSC5D-like [Eurytemora affinis]
MSITNSLPQPPDNHPILLLTAAFQLAFEENNIEEQENINQLYTLTLKTNLDFSSSDCSNLLETRHPQLPPSTSNPPTKPDPSTKPDPLKEPDSATDPDPSTKPDPLIKSYPSKEPDSATNPDPSTKPDPLTKPNPSTRPDPSTAPDPPTIPFQHQIWSSSTSWTLYGNRNTPEGDSQSPGENRDQFHRWATLSTSRLNPYTDLKSQLQGSRPSLKKE